MFCDSWILEHIYLTPSGHSTVSKRYENSTDSDLDIIFTWERQTHVTSTDTAKYKFYNSCTMFPKKQNYPFNLSLPR